MSWNVWNGFCIYRPPHRRREVYTTNTRIKKLRKALDLTQEAFGKRIGVKRNTIATYELGRNKPVDAVVALICREFHVNEEWLRTGSGEMFQEISREDELSAFFDDVLRGESDSFRKRFLTMMSQLDPSDWEVLEKMAREMARSYADAAAEPPQPTTLHPEFPPWDTSPDTIAQRPQWTPEERARFEAEARAEAEAYYQELLQEKRGEAGLSTSPPEGGGVA